MIWRAHVIPIVAILAACSGLSGCGQKGNLYLPNQNKKVPAAQPGTAPQSSSSSGPK
jgi:predicted small lipoprotein YifL